MTVLITGTGGVLIVTLVEKFTEGETDPREKPDERDMLARLLAERVQLAAEDDFGDFLFVRHRSAGVTCGERGQEPLTGVSSFTLTFVEPVGEEAVSDAIAAEEPVR